MVAGDTIRYSSNMQFVLITTAAFLAFGFAVMLGGVMRAPKGVQNDRGFEREK